MFIISRRELIWISRISAIIDEGPKNAIFCLKMVKKGPKTSKNVKKWQKTLIFGQKSALFCFLGRLLRILTGDRLRPRRFPSGSADCSAENG